MGWKNFQYCFQVHQIQAKQSALQHRKAKKHRPQRNLKKPHAKPVARNRKSQRPTKLTEEERDDPLLYEEAHDCDHLTCKVGFRIPWDDVRSRWFIPQMQMGHIHHHGHPRIESTLLRILPRHGVPLDKLNIAQSALDCEIGGNQTSVLVKARTGINLDWHQVQYLQTKQRNNLLASTEYSTAADKLIHFFAQPSISFVCLFA